MVGRGKALQMSSVSTLPASPDPFQDLQGGKQQIRQILQDDAIKKRKRKFAPQPIPSLKIHASNIDKGVEIKRSKVGRPRKVVKPDSLDQDVNELPAGNLDAGSGFVKDGAAGEAVNREKEQTNLKGAELLNDQCSVIQSEQAAELSQHATNSDLCAICDDGGALLCCDGPCIRSFHASERDASEDNKCVTLKIDSPKEAIEHGKWFCANCLAKEHQCFSCGKLGLSDDLLGDSQEVFVCDVALCGRFYHPKCVAKKNFRYFPAKQRVLEIQIENGMPFCCPLHRCAECGYGEFKSRAGKFVKLAKCRRCPLAWHEHCLPEGIRFHGTLLESQRAWKLQDQFLVYCLAHEIDFYLKTPARKHLQWPKPNETSQLHSSVAAQFPNGSAVKELCNLHGSDDDSKHKSPLQRSNDQLGVNISTNVTVEDGIKKPLSKPGHKGKSSRGPGRPRKEPLKGSTSTSHQQTLLKTDMLKEIVERLHWYIDDGDMVVDFCFGPKKFSVLLNERLQAARKNCFFRDYDFLPPSIVGLNPPMGTKSFTADEFILEAMKSRPKLLLLFVSSATMRYSKGFKECRYELIWKDAELPLVQSLYSTHLMDTIAREQVPLLYLWSRRDMAVKHRQIAVKQRHVQNIRVYDSDIEATFWYFRQPSPLPDEVDVLHPSAGHQLSHAPEGNLEMRQGDD